MTHFPYGTNTHLTPSQSNTCRLWSVDGADSRLDLDLDLGWHSQFTRPHFHFYWIFHPLSIHVPFHSSIHITFLSICSHPFPAVWLCTSALPLPSSLWRCSVPSHVSPWCLPLSYTYWRLVLCCLSYSAPLPFFLVHFLFIQWFQTIYNARDSHTLP